MGCVQSKRPRGERASRAVAHCRDRCELLAGAIASRYELADAHRAYAASLTATGTALHDFLRAVQDAAPPPPEPGAGVDAPWEGDGADTVPPAAVASPPPVPGLLDASDEEEDDGGHDDDVEDEASDVGDGGHTVAQSDDEPEPSLPRPEPEPIQPVAPAAPPTPQAPPLAPLQMVPSYVPGYPPPPYSYGPAAYGYGSYDGGYGGADMAGYGYGHSVHNYISYARSQPPPPPYVVQHPQVTVADVTAGYYHDDHQYHGEAVPTPTSPFGGYYSSYPYPYIQGGGSSPVPATSVPLPTTPSPPRAPTTWSYLDPFEGMETYYQSQDHHPAAASVVYEPSQTSTDVSLEGDLGELEAEDIHKLEDEGLPELEDDESGVVVGDAGRHARVERTCSCKSSSASEDDSGCNPAEEGHIQIISLDGVEGENSVVEEQQHLNDTYTTGVAEPAAVPEKTYTDVEVVDEIKAQFDTASKSAEDVCKMLEVGKVPYYKKNSGFKVPSLVIFGQRSKGKVVMQFEEEKAMECGNLSCSLEKLYMWEKKLLKEVKALEKIIELYEHKHKVQRKMYYNSAEADKLEAMQKCVNKIQTKVNISIDIVISISKSINKLRDEELWPQTHELIQGFMKMWHTMSECHHMQCHIFSHAKNIESNVEAAILSEDHIHLVKQLENQLLDMTKNFSGWFNAQKKYATFLNEWLKRGIEYAPEVTDDGVPPFSPRRLGAPPIFSIYNNWAISIGRISDVEVVGTLHAFTFNVRSIWGEKVGISSSDAQAAEAPLAEDSLLSCMTRVFGAMENFTTACENAYKQGSLYSG